MPIREIISGYDSPIILGLTPYTKTQITVGTLGSTDWPPFVDSDRLATYENYTALIENDAQAVFSSLQLAAEQATKIAIAVALPELLCNVWADSVWSDPPTIEFDRDPLTERWREIDEATNFSESLAWESVFGAAGWGTSVLYLRRDESRRDEFGTDVVIDEIDPAIFFPVLKAGSSREIESVTLAWEVDRAAPDEAPDLWQMREFHTIEDGQYVITTQERRTKSALSGEAFRLVSVERPEGVDFLPFVDMHAKRWRGRYWGVSEIARMMGLLDELDNTLSNIAEILEYHGKPMLQVPAAAIYGGTFVKGADRALGIRRSEDAGIARYITFDGMLNDQLAHLQSTLELIMLTAEVPRTYFGLGETAAAPSGVSLKLQLQNYLKKAARWQRTETSRLKRLVPMALKLDGRFDAAILNESTLKVTHGSPLPADDEQTVRIVQAAIMGGFLSKKTGVRSMKRLGYIADEDDEMAEIEDEKEASIAALPAPMRENIGGNSSTNPNGGDESPA